MKMETFRLNSETSSSFLTQRQVTSKIMTIPLPKVESLTDNNNNQTETDTIDAATVKSMYKKYSTSEMKISAFVMKNFHYSNSTLATEIKEKSCLRNRLPDFSPKNKPLVGSKLFFHGSFHDKPRKRRARCRGTTFPQDEGHDTDRLPTNGLERARSLCFEKDSVLRARINSLNRDIQSEGRMRRRISKGYTERVRRKRSKDYVVQEGASKESTPNHQGSFIEEEEIDNTHEEKCFKNVELPKQRRPIERFQKIVRLLCFLLKIKFRIERKYKQPQHSVVFEQLEELTESGISSDDGMVFDPKYFKAIREVKLNPDAVQILSMCPGTRTEEQIQAALVGLKAAVAAFGEYPLKMQRTLVNVGWYESFEAKRVIIRQGHRAENFYFILSGTALVTLLVNDPATGEERSTTIAVLEKGSSFGELALLHHKTRSATVLCKNEVALLAVGREDFRNIFMSYEDGKEPDHVQFLRTIPYLKHLPLDQCVTRHDVCIFHYFRRGVVILKNSNTEWIYVLKSGSCRVLTNLAKRRNSTSSLRGNETILNLPVIPVNEFERRRLLYTASGERTSRVAWSPENKRPRTEPEPRKGKSDLSLPAITGDNEKFKKTVKKVNFALPWLEKFNPKDAQEQVNAHRQRIVSLYREMTDAALLNNKDTNLKKDNKNSEKLEHVCVQIELIKPKDQFGLASILYDNDAVKCHFVSNGAECILIKKSWFLQNTSEAVMRELRAQIPPYPTQETLEQNLQDQANWESFKSQTISDLLDTLHL